MKFSFSIGFFILTGRIGLRMQTLNKQDWTDFSWQHNVYNGKLIVKSGLEHGVGIEYSYFQLL